MKTSLLSLTILCFVNLNAQQTFVPDDNFEAYLEANAMGNGIPNDDYATTTNISGVITLNIDSQNISDLTGIEDFTVLTNLYCNLNQLTTLDLSQNLNLNWLQCHTNQIASIDVTQNLNLAYLGCWNNNLSSLDISMNSGLIEIGCGNNPNLSSLDVTQNSSLMILDTYGNPLTSLDLSQNSALTTLFCGYNQLTSLDFSQNLDLTYLQCHDNQLSYLELSLNNNLIELNCSANQLTCLNVKNGNNALMSNYDSGNNPNLFCIEVDDIIYSQVNWTNIDAASSFSSNCNNACTNYTGIEELAQGTVELLKITDLIGRETEFKSNTPLIYIYSDGNIERVFVIGE